jgi:hypothetical protein
MTTIAVLRRRSDNLAQRWLRTGRDHARSDASSHHQSQPAIATFNDSLDHQAELLPLVRRLINRLQGLCASALTPSASAKDAMRRTKAASFFLHSPSSHRNDVRRLANG